MLLIVISRQDELWEDLSFTNTGLGFVILWLSCQNPKENPSSLHVTLIKFERMSYVFSQNCLNKSQIPCKIKVICKMNTLELLWIILGFEEAYWPFFFLMDLVVKRIGLGIQWDEKNLWKFIPEIREIKINFHTISGAWVGTWH